MYKFSNRTNCKQPITNNERERVDKFTLTDKVNYFLYRIHNIIEEQLLNLSEIKDILSEYVKWEYLG